MVGAWSSPPAGRALRGLFAAEPANLIAAYRFGSVAMPR
jgi:hypothetical protein